jgi:hypothetical protein
MASGRFSTKRSTMGSEIVLTQHNGIVPGEKSLYIYKGAETL